MRTTTTRCPLCSIAARERAFAIPSSASTSTFSLPIRPSIKATPILVLTTENDAQKKARAKAAGATGWIVKPFDPKKLVDAINRVAP